MLSVKKLLYKAEIVPVMPIEGGEIKYFLFFVLHF